MNHVSFNYGRWGRPCIVETVLVVDEQFDWLAEADFMLSSLGYQCLTASSRAQASAHLDEFDISTVIIAYNMPGANGMTLMEELSERARKSERPLRFIMATSHATLDIALLAMRASAVDLLEKPITREQMQKALLRVRGIELETPARMELIGHLTSLSAEMQRISALIDSPESARVPAPAPLLPSVTERPDDDSLVTPAFIRQVLRNEAKRRKLGNGALFGDPAWDMLLDLMIAQLQGERVPVSSACIASGAPTTTALRLINRLVAASILRRVPDEKDGRRDFLEIDPSIQGQVMAYLRELAKAQ